MKSAARWIPALALTAGFLFLAVFEIEHARYRRPAPGYSPATAHHAARHDRSQPLVALHRIEWTAARPDCTDCGLSPGNLDDPDDDQPPQGGASTASPAAPALPLPPAAAAIEQKTAGTRPAAALIASFDGLGYGFDGPQGAASSRNPSDNSLAAGPSHIVQIVNSRMAIFSKTGKVLYGAVPTSSIFKGFGGPCEERNNGDAVVRYDQLADRWLFVMPIFSRIADRPDEPYAMCYALSEGGDPMGSYYRYEFRRRLFPDYPRPAIWTDGYYVPSSTGDDVIQKHDCVVDRTIMLKGRDASEQCVIVDGVNFLNNADLDGQSLPPSEAPNIVMAAGGSQLKHILEDDGIYAYQFHVDWDDPEKTSFSKPVKIPVAPYQYLCGGQLTRCVTQPGAAMRLDAQGDKIMQRLVYRNFGDHESIVAVHSVNTSSGAGGVRWYEFRLNARRDPLLYQQGTYAPDGFFRWMGSPAMDRAGNIGIGFSFGGEPNFAGQRFAARLADDTPGQLTLAETPLVTGEAAQTDTYRWEDYATTAIDPSDDCTFWYVGDYYKAGARTYSTRIGAFRLPDCIQHRASGVVYLDRNHNGQRDNGEPGVAGVPVAYSGARNGVVASGANGSYTVQLPADSVYGGVNYSFSARPSAHAAWSAPAGPLTISLADPNGVANLDFAGVCSVPNRGGETPQYWLGSRGKAVLQAHAPAWQELLHQAVQVDLNSYDELRQWLATAGWAGERAAAALNVALGMQDGEATVHDTVAGDWPPVRELIARAKSVEYLPLLQKLNRNQVAVTPSTPAGCGAY